VPVAGLPDDLADPDAALVGDTQRRRVMVIVNPHATTVSDRLRTLIVAALRGRYEAVAVDTRSRDDATRLARAAADEGFDAVVVLGGDGTLNEAANGIADARIALFPLPGGATNVFARLLGIPPDPVDATEHLLSLADSWRPRRVDLAVANGRSFLFSAGLGLDAAVVRRSDRHPRAKARFKQTFFAAVAVGTFVQEYLVRPPCLEAQAGDRRMRGVTAIVQNGPVLTYFHDRPVEVVEGVTLDDGCIGGVMLERATPLDVPGVAARLLSERLRVSEHPRVATWPNVAHAVVRSVDNRPVPLEVDGDYIGDVTEAAYAVDDAPLFVVS
jgi:diacylglycerol kinase family enzyme